MCSRVWVCAIIAALTLDGMRPLTAQRAVSHDARAQERIVDTLVANWRRTAAALMAFDDSVARLRAVTDTLRIGSLRVMVEPALRARAEVAARRASARIDTVALAGAKVLERHWMVVHFVNDSSRDTVVVAVRATRGGEYLSTAVATDSLIADQIYRVALQLLSSSLDRPFHEWLGTTRAVTPDTLSTVSWLSTRLDVVSSDAPVARRCYDGDLTACKIALRLIEVADPVMQWYDAAARQLHVKRVAPFRSYLSRPVGADVESCTRGADAACIALMRQWPETNDPIPAQQRTTVANIAVQMGGRAGFERLLIATGTPAERLAFVSGAPLDSVLRVWLAKVHDTRRPSQDMTPGIAFTSFGWILVCGLLALRSTRWR